MKLRLLLGACSDDEVKTAFVYGLLALDFFVDVESST